MEKTEAGRRPKLHLKKGGGRALKAGGLWIYDNEIETTDAQAGETLTVLDFDGFPLGVGFYNPASKLAVRMLTRDAARTIDAAFFYERVKAAWTYRKKTVETGSCRVIFGEADFLPGFIVDKYEDILVVQSLALGIDRYKEELLRQLVAVLAEDAIVVRGIYERSDAKVRLQEGMERRKGFLSEPFDTRVEITENGVRYLVDVENGQKTGFFLDQKENRKSIRRLCAGAEVLDCFTHTGAFALNAAYAGAKRVLGVDASEEAIAMARSNAALNGFLQTEFLCADVFDLLPAYERENKRFDVVILDPPAFTKSRESVKNAVKGYREINSRAMKLVKDGGFFATCSCSHFMQSQLFAETIGQAAHTAHRRLRQIEFRTQAPDHPILWSAEETNYLKFYIFQVINER